MKEETSNIPIQPEPAPTPEEAALRHYFASLTPEDHEEMRETTDIDVLAKVRSIIEELKVTEAKPG